MMVSKVSAAKRRTNNRWDAKNMTVVGCKVCKDIAAEFRAACVARGTTPNAVFRAVIDDFIQEKRT